jgi:MFS family permease
MVEGHTGILILRFLSGFVGGGVFAIVVAALGDNREPDRAFGIAQAVQGLVMGALFAWAPSLMSNSGINSLFYLMALLALTTLIFLPRFPRYGVVGASPESTDIAGDSSASVPPALYFGLFGGFIERMGTQAGLEETTIGYALGISQLAAIFGALLAAAAAQRFGRFVPILIALVGQLWVLWVLVGQFSAWSFYAGACAYQGLYVMATSYQLGVIAHLDSKGKFIVVMTALQGLGAALGPSIAAGLINEGDYSGINTAAAATLIISLGLFLYLAHSADGRRAK